MKVKEMTLKNQKRDFELDMSFSEWLDYFSKKLTSKEIDDIEKQSSNIILFKHIWNMYISIVFLFHLTRF